MQESITFKVDLDPQITDQEASSLKDTIAHYPYVKHIDYISKEEAASIFSEDLGEDFVGFIGYNPLYPSLMVNLKSELLPDNSQKALNQFTHEVKRLHFVTDVTYQENIVNSLNDIFYKITWFLIVFLALLLFVSIILINNTIKVSIYSSRRTIRTMRLVGAKMNFISRPFLNRSIFYGFLGGLFAIVLLAGLAFVFNQQFSLNFLASENYIPYALMAGVILVMGIIFSFFSTYFAVHGQLRGKESQLD